MRGWFQSLRDQGVDTGKLSAKIRRNTSRKLNKAMAREILVNR